MDHSTKNDLLGKVETFLSFIPFPSLFTALTITAQFLRHNGNSNSMQGDSNITGKDLKGIDTQEVPGNKGTCSAFFFIVIIHFSLLTPARRGHDKTTLLNSDPSAWQQSFQGLWNPSEIAIHPPSLLFQPHRFKQ